MKVMRFNLKVDAGPDREPIEISNHIFDAGVHVGFGYRMNSIQRGLSHNACERALYSLQLFDVSVGYTIGKRVVIVMQLPTIALAPPLGAQKRNLMGLVRMDKI